MAEPQAIKPETQATKPENNSTPKRPKKKLQGKRKPLNIPSSKMPLFILDSTNCQKLYAENKVLQKILKHKNMTHKFVITNCKASTVSKRNILEAFTSQCLPNLIIPLNIEYNEKKTLIFYSSHCVNALERLIEDNLTVTCKVKSKDEVKLYITLYVACKDPCMDINVLVRSVLEPRISTDGPVTANLSNLANIAGWADKIYINLRAPVAINVILNSIRKNGPKYEPTILDLHQNDIESLRGWMNYFTIDAINLSYTKIKSFQDLGPLLKMDIKKINLQETPIRQQYSDQKSFNEKVRKLFPNVVIDETTNLETKKKILGSPKFPPRYRYEDIEEYGDHATYLVDQFMEHYFHFYDNPKTKRLLENIYHKDAIFSMTSFIRDEPQGLNPVSERFKHHAHNLLDKKVNEYVVGPREIMRKLCYLPNVIHDPVSFRVDVLHYVENERVLFSINGACKEKRIYKFSRTFLLQATENGEYQIKNDLLHVTNDLPSYIPYFGDLYNAPITINIDLEGKLPFIAKNVAQQYGMTILFIDITRLHIQYAREILQRAHWNMKVALEIFVEDMRYDKFTYEHFLHDEIKQIVINCLPALRGGKNVDKIKKMLDNMQCLTEDRFILLGGKDNRVSNKSKKDEIKKLLQIV